MMSDTAPGAWNIRDIAARIDRNQAETAKLLAEQPKLFAEQSKLLAEHRKLHAEALKLGRDTSFLPWQVVAALMVAGGGLVGATVTLMRLLGP